MKLIISRRNIAQQRGKSRSTPENINLTAEATDTACAAKIVQSQYLGYATSYLVAMSNLESHVLELRRHGANPHWEWQEALIPATRDNAPQRNITDYHLLLLHRKIILNLTAIVNKRDIEPFSLYI